MAEEAARSRRSINFPLQPQREHMIESEVKKGEIQGTENKE